MVTRLMIWVSMCALYIAKPAHFYSGARKIIQGTSYLMPAIDSDLQLADIGYTKSKLTMLRRFYRHEESIAVAKRLWDKRLDRGTYGSVGFSTFNHMVKSEKTSIRGSVMGPCILGITLTLTPDGTMVDCFYRTTEMFKKLPADLIFIRDELLPEFPIPRPLGVRFHFANATMHPMYVSTLIPFWDDPIAVIDNIKDERFKLWSIKWLNRYLVPKYANGIAKYAQGLRVQKHALESIDKDVQKELRKYLEPRFNSRVDDIDEEDNEV